MPEAKDPQELFETNPLLLLSRKEVEISESLRDKLKELAGSRYKPITVKDLQRP